MDACCPRAPFLPHSDYSYLRRVHMCFLAAFRSFVFAAFVMYACLVRLLWYPAWAWASVGKRWLPRRFVVINSLEQSRT